MPALGAVVAAMDIPAAPVLAVMLLGVVVALVGHIARDLRVVAVGIAAIFLATGLMFVFAFASFQGADGDGDDPRPCTSPYGAATGC